MPSCNTDKNKEKSKDYYENNKETILEKQKQYREDNREQIKEHKKQYREDNKEKIKENDKKYYEKNKDKILEKMKEKITCECGAIITKCHFNRHTKSIRHRGYITLKNNINNI